jgi:hypothetical protein
MGPSYRDKKVVGVFVDFFRAPLHWAERKGYTVETLDWQDGDEKPACAPRL